MTKRLRKLAAIAVLALALCSQLALPGAAFADDPFDQQYLGQGHTKAEIIAKWNALRPTDNGSSIYDTEAVLSGSHAPATLTDEALANGLNSWNFARWLADLQDINFTEAANASSAKGALICGVLNAYEHLPTNSVGMEAGLFDEAYYSTSHSNLFMTTGPGNPPVTSLTIFSWLDDIGVSNLGHRRWVLYPELLSSGMGAAPGSASGTFVVAATFGSFAPTNISRQRQEVCWPAAGYFPFERFSNGAPWSVSLGSGYGTQSAAAITITIDVVDDGSGSPGSTEVLAGSGFTLDVDGYGTPICLIFSPSSSPAVGKAYHIKIDGLTPSGGGTTSFEYDIKFFSLADTPPATPTITISSQPAASTDLYAGSISGSLAVTASASDGGSLFYQWYSNSSASNSGGTAIDGADSASFAIPTGLGAGTYYYYCVVSAVEAPAVASTVATVNVETWVAVSGITLDESSLVLFLDTSFILTASVQPADANNQAVEWTSSDDSVATVGSDGTVTAVGPGLATITAKSADGGFEASCAVTVSIPYSLTVSAGIGGAADGSESGTYSAGDPINLTALPDSGYHFVDWTVSGITIVDKTANPLGFIMPAANVTVIANFASDFPPISEVPVSGVTITKPGSSTLEAGQTLQLTAVVSPADAANTNVTWTSSDPGIASVSSAGLVTALKAGAVEINVVTDDGGFVATLSLTVTASGGPGGSGGSGGSGSGSGSGSGGGGSTTPPTGDKAGSLVCALAAAAALGSLSLASRRRRLLHLKLC